MNKWIAGASIAIFIVVVIVALSVNSIFETIHTAACKDARNYVKTYKECLIDRDCELGFVEHKTYANKKEFYKEYCDESEEK